MEPQMILAGLELANKALDGLKKLQDMITNKNDIEIISKELEKASESLKIGEAQIAQGLGYEICKCTFPPQICLSIGRPRGYEQSQCPLCHEVYPDKPLGPRIRTLSRA